MSNPVETKNLPLCCLVLLLHNNVRVLVYLDLLEATLVHCPLMECFAWLLCHLRTGWLEDLCLWGSTWLVRKKIGNFLARNSALKVQLRAQKWSVSFDASTETREQRQDKKTHIWRPIWSEAKASLVHPIPLTTVCHQPRIREETLLLVVACYWFFGLRDPWQFLWVLDGVKTLVHCPHLFPRNMIKYIFIFSLSP